MVKWLEEWLESQDEQSWDDERQLPLWQAGSTRDMKACSGGAAEAPAPCCCRTGVPNPSVEESPGELNTDACLVCCSMYAWSVIVKASSLLERSFNEDLRQAFSSLRALMSIACCSALASSGAMLLVGMMSAPPSGASWMFDIVHK